ncbi:MAG: eukaryotic-like serine/threonine-protein kinase [Archaeoglobi archaeon]|nr:eukaryotic-like serine/threonine-protein kinase [Archaeoglobi archaeon]
MVVDTVLGIEKKRVAVCAITFLLLTTLLTGMTSAENLARKESAKVEFAVGADVLNHTIVYPLEITCKFVIPVKNVGDVPLTIHAADIRGVPDEWISLGGGDLWLEPGEEGYMINLFSIPPKAKTKEASVVITLRALEEESVEIPVTLNVGFAEVQPESDAEILGRILDEDGDPIPNAEITAFYWSGNEIARAISGFDGSFHLRVPSFETLESLLEKYSLRGKPCIYLYVSADGYEVAYKEFAPKRGERIQYEFKLRPLEMRGSYHEVWSVQTEDCGVWLAVPTEDWSLIAVSQGEHPFPYIKAPEKTHIYLLDGNGSVVWRKEIEKESWGVDITADGKVAAGSYAGKLYVWNLEGELLWSVNLPVEEPIREVRFSHSGTYLAYGPTEEGRGYFALCDAETGEKLWSYRTGDHVRRIVFTEDDEYVVVSSTDGFTYLFTIDGRLLWKRFHGGYVPFVLEASHENNMIVVGGKGLELYAYDFQGELLWKHEMPEVVLCGDATPDLSRIAVVVQNTLYFISRDGEILWKRPISPPGHNALAITPDGNYIVAGCMDGLKLFDNKGNEVWSFEDFNRGEPPYSEHPFLCTAQTVQISPDASKILAGFGETDRRVIMFSGGIKPGESEESEIASPMPSPVLAILLALILYLKFRKIK